MIVKRPQVFGAIGAETSLFVTTVRSFAAVPEITLAQPLKNADAIIRLMERAEEKKADLVLFPELCLTGVTCGDLYFRDDLWRQTKQALGKITLCSAKYPGLTAVIGLPVRSGSKLYNCAAVISRGEVNGLVPKTRLSQRERRWFSPGISCWLEPEALDDLVLRKARLWLDGGSMFGNCSGLFQRVVLACPRKIVVEALNRLKEAVSQL